MNTNNGALYFGAGINLQQWRRDVDSMRRDILGLSQTTVQQSQVMNSAFKDAFAGLAGYFSITAIKGFITELINIRGEFQKTEIAFTTMLGSGVKAAELMSQMVDLAAKTPFGLQEVSAGAKQLLAFQIPANQVVDILTRMGNIAAGLGVPLSRINLVYGQVKAKGKLMGDDLRQFTEAGIPMIAELATKFGKTEAEITKMVSAGKIGFKDVQDVLFSLTNEGGMFYNLMEKQSASLSGKIANLGDTWDQMLNKIGESNEGLLNDAIEGVTKLVENYEEVIKVLQVLIVTYGAYRAALIVTNSLQAGAVAPAVIQGFRNLILLIRGATVAQSALNAATISNPYILLATAIAGLIAVVITYRKEIDNLLHDYSALAQQIKYNENVQEKYASTFSKGIVDNREKIVSLIAVINNENSKLEDRKRAYENLIKIDDAFRGALDEQYRATYRLGGAFDYVIEKMQRFALVQAEMAVKTEYLKQNAEDEFNLSIAKVKYAEAERAAKKYGDLLKQGKISIKEYSEYMKPFEDVAVNLIKSQKAVNASRKDVDYVNKAEKEKLETLSKQAVILSAQLRGGKMQGKVISEEMRSVLIRKLKDVKEEMRLRMGEVMEEIAKTDPKKLGWAQQIKEQIDALEAEADSAQTQAAYQRIRAKIDALNEKLHPKKKRKEKQQQLAEFLPLGSPEQIQQQISLLDKAMSLVENGMIKLRRLDKFGNDKDKEGNPFLTGEIISLEEAGKRREALEDRLNKIQYKNFQEKIDESERQWNNYYRMAEYYGKEVADAQYRELFKGAESYLQFLQKQEAALSNLAKKGLLSDQQKQDLTFLRDKIKSLTGIDTPFENVKKGIESALKNIPSLVDQLEFINKSQDINKFLTGGKSNAYFDQNKYFEGLKESVLQQQQDLYTQFEKDHQTFEQRKTDITKNYDLIRTNIQKQNISDVEKARLIAESNKAETKEISAASLEAFQKTDLWIKAFGDLEKVGPRTLEKLKKGLEQYLASNAGVIKADELKIIQDQIIKLSDTITNKDPFKALGNAIDIYKKKRKELYEIEKQSGKTGDKYLQKLEETEQAFVDITQNAGTAVNAMISYASEITKAFGGVSDEMKETIDNVQKLTTGITTAISSYIKNDYGQMMSGIAQSMMAIVNLVGGDNERQKDIKQWERAIDGLKNAYEDLRRSIEKTAGEASLTQQRNLIANLKQQQQTLNQMRDTEFNKKGKDKDKVAAYTQQINDINRQIEDLVENFKQSVTTVEFKDLSKRLAEALVDAFSQGEDAASSFEKVVDDVMRNAVANALRMQILEPVVKDIVDKLYASMGYGTGNTTQTQNEIKQLEQEIANTKIKMEASGNFQEVKAMEGYIMQLQQKINELKEKLAQSDVGGSFDGLTEKEREELKAMGEKAMQDYMAALEQYKELFNQSAENAQGLKGGIKGITEKTAGALEGQVNSMRILQAEVHKIQKESRDVLRNQLLIQVQIEKNTRPLEGIYKEIRDLNSKVKKGAAGIP